MIPARISTSGSGPAPPACRMVSSYMITPLTNADRPGVVKSISRSARRVSLVDGIPTAPHLLPMVDTDSSLARMPFPAATSACAVPSRLGAVTFATSST